MLYDINRFGQWDSIHCNSSWGHSTCEDPYRCDLFNDKCGFGVRCDAFVNQNNDFCRAEGLCGANVCFTTGHCSALFNPDSWIFSVGFAPGGNGITVNYIDPGTDPINLYSIPNGAHFDERIKVHSEDYNINNNHLTFLMQYWNQNEQINNAYVVYNGNVYQMELLAGNSNSAIYRKNMPVKYLMYSYNYNL